MELKDIRQLIKIVENANIGELEIVEDGKKLRISKNNRNSNENIIYSTPQVQAFPTVAAPVPLNQVSMPTELVPTKTEGEAASGESVAGDYLEVKSPMVGTFYRAPSPDADSYVNVGQNVTIGQTMCIIEAMKLMNELESEYSGKVVKILVENAQPVEYNQTLFLIEKT
jgi:acetyl-CoA carboxylase biotin carboxyl carrier protein